MAVTTGRAAVDVAVDARRPSAGAQVVTAMQSRPMALVRHGSQMLFQTDKTATPLHKRGIFWVYTAMALVGFSAAVAFLVLYFAAEVNNTHTFSYNTQAPTTAAMFCPYGGCTASPTPLRGSTSSPVVSGR